MSGHVLDCLQESLYPRGDSRGQTTRRMDSPSSNLESLSDRAIDPVLRKLASETQRPLGGVFMENN